MADDNITNTNSCSSVSDDNIFFWMITHIVLTLKLVVVVLYRLRKGVIMAILTTAFSLIP